jgi:hypothetical protein
VRAVQVCCSVSKVPLRRKERLDVDSYLILDGMLAAGHYLEVAL